MARRQLAIGLALGLIGLCISSTSTEAQQRVRPEECTRELARSAFETRSWDDIGAQRAIAETCSSVGATARGVQAARARFYSGRAYNRIAGQEEEAIRQLEIAVNSGQDFESQFTRELRAARLELVGAYRADGRLEAARNLLGSSALRPSDPAVAYQRAMLILAELREAGRESAFEQLRGVFVQDDVALLGSASDPTGLTPSEIRRGRSWLYWLGMSLGQEALGQEGQSDEQRRADALRAIGYFGPVASAISAACPDQGPIDCGNGIGPTEQIGSLGYPNRPTPDQLLSASFQLGVAHLKAAGVRETPGLSSISGETAVGEAGGLDCFSGNFAPDAGSHFQNARYAFETVTRRSPQGGQAAADARWGLGCAILANVGRVPDSGEQQRQLAQAVEQLRQVPDRPLTLLTLARAQVLQGQFDSARASYQRALSMAGPDTQCRPGREPNSNARAELPSRIYLELARTRFAEPLSYGRPRDSGDLFARTITEVSRARPQALREAETELQCAISLNYSNAEARLTLGHIYLRLGSDGELDPPPFNRALQTLRYFERPIGSGQEGRAEGLYLLSRRETMLQQNRLLRGGAASGGSGSNAVGYATQAYNTVQRPEFRRQACMAQMLFGNTREEGYCSASGQGDERAESLLYEGMYWLRRGQRERGDRMRSWSRSIQAFNRGLSDSSGGSVTGVHPSLPETMPLQDLLHYGERYVLRCTSLDYGDREAASDDTRRFFRLSGMPDPCGGPPR
jgi:tetratricopeptide (TPR) repeat protein